MFRLLTVGTLTLALAPATLRAETGPERPAASAPATPPPASGAAETTARQGRKSTPVPLPKDEWAVGAALLTIPKYPGSSAYRVLPVPMVRYENGSGFFASPFEGIGVKADNGDFAAGVAVRYDFNSRSPDTDRRFAQWDRIEGAPAGVVFGEYRFGRNFLKVSHNQRITRKDEDGGYTHAELGRTVRVLDGGKHIIQAGLSTDFMDGDYANTFFTVTPAQAATSGLRARDAHSGFATAGVFTNYIWKISPRVGAFVRVTVEHLEGDAGAAPFVRSRLYGTGIFSVVYRF